MKLKLTASLLLPTLIMLSSAGCVTSTDSYTRDIVYRDGSYYSPADDQNGDYYYAPEPDYSYYADDYYDSYYGFNQNYYRSSRYGRYESGCRFSYHRDRYCNSGWGGSYLNFGGLTIIFGNSNRYDYGYGSGYGYGNSYGYNHSNYGYNSGYPYYGGGYAYYGSHAPRPRPRSNDPIAMPKPTRPTGHAPDNNFSGGPTIRVSGEPTLISSKPGLVETHSSERGNEAQENAQDNRNSDTRTGNERRRNIQPEIWRNAVENDADNGIPIRGSRQPRQRVQEEYAPRIRTKPAMLIDGNAYEMPVRQQQQQERRVQPYQRDNEVAQDRQKAPTPDYSNNSPPEQAREDNRQERQAPPPRERVERVERAEQSESPVRAARAESNEEANGADETR